MENKYLDNCVALDNVTDGVSFFRRHMKAGESVVPALDPEQLIVLLFSGSPAYVQTKEDIFNITGPAVFIPDFDRSPYTVRALEDLDFILCVFTMNEWDKDFFKGWNLHLPFFSAYGDGVRFNHAGRSGNLSSWSLIQPFQLGHFTISFICGTDGKVESDGNPLQNQWLYDVNSGLFRFIQVGQPYSLCTEENRPISCFIIGYFAEPDLQKNYLAQIFNGRLTETR